MSTPTGDTTEARLLEYAREFIRGYSQAIDTNYPNAKTFIHEAGLNHDYFPLYGRELGVDVAISAFFTKADFYLFFLGEYGVEIKRYEDGSANDASEFSKDWTFNTPDEQRIQKIKEYLGLKEANTLRITPYCDAINIAGADMMAPFMMRLGEQGYRHGTGFGNQAGARADGDLPELREMLHKTSRQAEIAAQYTLLTKAGMSRQARGIEFEKLWRDVLDFYGWKPKKIRIPGEDNDFTAIYQGLHILGEVRWFDKPMNGAKMREFLAKLDPRPQTIGLFVSRSDVDPGGMSVVRRAVNSKTVVIFGKADIEKVILEFADPGPIFDEKLRDAYDYIFETTEGS